MLSKGIIKAGKCKSISTVALSVAIVVTAQAQWAGQRGRPHKM